MHKAQRKKKLVCCFCFHFCLDTKQFLLLIVSCCV